ncbi:MAG: CAP domain-containing protein [Nocardioides sp.]
MNSSSMPARPLVHSVMAAAVALVAVLGLSAVAAPAQAAAGASSRVMSMSSERYEQKVQLFINKQRAKRGLSRLSIESCTDGTAERWANKLATSNAFYHQSMGNILTTCRAYYAGETLGKGAISPHRLVSMWMHSPAHRHVLLSKHAKRIGVGAFVDSSGSWVTAANFTKF